MKKLNSHDEHVVESHRMDWFFFVAYLGANDILCVLVMYSRIWLRFLVWFISDPYPGRGPTRFELGFNLHRNIMEAAKKSYYFSCPATKTLPENRGLLRVGKEGYRRVTI